VSDKCNAELHIGDDFGDNHATMICQLEKDHGGCHIEKWNNNEGDLRLDSWHGDDRDE